MHVGVIGINHKSASLSLREVFAEASRKCLQHGKKGSKRCNAFVLLNTCNRTEVYFSAEELTWVHRHLLSILKSNIETSFEHTLYSYFAYECFSHLSMVTAGLDSAIIAETEIQGQVKNAYENCSAHGELPSALHFMFQKSLKIGKDVRTKFQLSRDLPSLSHAIIRIGAFLFPQLNSAKILFIGASQINLEIINHFTKKGFENLFLCNRSFDHAQEYAGNKNLDLIPWLQLKSWSNYDIIIVGTKAHKYLLEKDNIYDKDTSPTLLFDLCVPRNIDPDLEEHPHITLYNIDKIHGIIEKTYVLNSKKLLQAERYVLESVEKQMAIFSHKGKNRHHPAIANTP